MKSMLKIGVGVTCVLLQLGCGPAPSGTPSDETLISDDQTLILEVLDTYTQSLVAKDIDRCLSLVSEYYSDPQRETKDAVRESLIAAKDAGELDDLKVSIDEVKIVIDGEGIEATASPVNIRDGIWTFTLVKEEGSWLIIGGED